MELFRALAVLAEPPGPEAARLAEVLELGASPTPEDYTELFLFQLYPYASVYLGPEGQLGGEARDRIAGFWRALGPAPPAEPDHLAALLGLYAQMAEAERKAVGGIDRATWRQGCHALLWEHLFSWLPPFLHHLRGLAPDPYRRWAVVVAEALDEEARRLGGPVALPAHLRDAPGLPQPEVGAEAWLAAVLAPVRAGIILTRADLARGAQTLGLGLRAGERRFVLRTLIEQDANATLDWLAGEARVWQDRHRSLTTPGGEAVSRWWAARAGSAAASFDRVQAKENTHA